MTADIPQAVYERYNMLYVCSRYSDAYALILPYAEQGFSYAQYCLGMLYLLGYGVHKNHHLAFYWLEFAGQNGHRMAREILRCMRDKAALRVAQVAPACGAG